MTDLTPERLTDLMSLYEGDCLRVLPTLQPGSVDAVITDPPYGIDYQSNRRTATEQLAKIKNDARPFVWWLHGAAAALKEGGCLVCFCRWDTADTFRQCIELTGLSVKQQLVWDRGVHGMGDLKGSPAPRHDIIWFAAKGRFILPGKRPTSMYSHMRLSGGNLTHPNEKPVSLMKALVEDYTAVGQTVLDPFGGSGATAKAAANRNCVLVEMDADYCGAIRRHFRGEVVTVSAAVVESCTAVQSESFCGL